MPRDPHVAAVLLADGPHLPRWDLYGFGIVNVVFGIDHSDLDAPWYQLRVTADEARTAPESVASVDDIWGLESLIDADTVIVPAVSEDCVHGRALIPEPMLDALRAAHAAGARVASLCTGAFALAAAGLLDGRRATAHWEHTTVLARRFPSIDVVDSVLYTDDGDILTSAGLSAGLDLCLHLVRADRGTAVVGELARRLIVPIHRPGGQAQYVRTPILEPDDHTISDAMAWAREQLESGASVSQLARQANMSVRTFQRRFRDQTGSTPSAWLQRERIDRARSLLETTALPIDQVSRLSGLGTPNNLRHHFRHALGISPTDYRRSFGR